jgi:hypothetical protein
MNTAYTSTLEKLVERIAALVPFQPQILTLQSCWDLFKVPGFQCADLAPSMAQAAAALAEVQRTAAKTTGH